TGATCCSVEVPGWPTRSGIFGLLSGVEASFGCSTVGEDLNSPLTLKPDLNANIPAPTRIITTPMAIALLNGNTVADRGRLGARSRSEPIRVRGAGGGGGV